MKLTPKQNDVINCLQNGYIIITDNTVTGALIANDNKNFKINNRLFWNLVDKGLIIQQNSYPFHFVLTDKGIKIKTKKV